MFQSYPAPTLVDDTATDMRDRDLRAASTLVADRATDKRSKRKVSKCFNPTPLEVGVGPDERLQARQAVSE